MLGQHDAHIRTIEQALGVRIGATGTSLRISGGHAEQAMTGKLLGDLYELLKRGLSGLSAATSTTPFAFCAAIATPT